MWIRIASATTFVLSSPAVAGWQYTNWGMSPEQVVAASKGKASSGSGEPGDRVSDSPLEVGAVGTHSSGKWQFRTVFYFDGGKLSYIKATLQNGEKGCGSLWADMKSVYGKPFSEDHDAIMGTAIWQDSTKNNRVALLEIGDLCAIDYKPLKSADNQAL